MLRALFTQKMLQTMITAHEKRMKWRYDAIAVARMDVLHTRPIPLRVYRGILHYQHPSTNESFVLPPLGHVPRHERSDLYCESYKGEGGAEQARSRNT